jgi:predicted acyl esterase
MRIAVVCACLAVLAPSLGLRATADAAPTQFDYAKVAGLSSKVYKSFVREKVMLPMADGIKNYVEILRPKASGRFPVIAEISPYHGTIYERDGKRMNPNAGGLTGYFVPRGYAVLMMDVRGTGRSQGCLDQMGRNDQSDAKRVIEWAASRSWSNGRVGILGHSYPGGTSVMSLAERPKGLVTAVVSAGLGSMYEHQFQAGVPYNLQWAGPYIGYYPLSLERHLPVGLPEFLIGSGNGGDNFGNDMQYFGCGATGFPDQDGDAQLSGRYIAWHAERDFRKGAARNPVPVFVIHGVNDQAARIASLDWFFRRHNSADKAWIGQWDHGVGCCPNRRGWQWTRALHAWFDRQLQQRDVDTGPPVEVFLGDGSEEAAISGARTVVYAPHRFTDSDRTLTFYPSSSGKMSTVPPSKTGSNTFAGDAFGYFDRSATDGVEFRTRQFTSDKVMVGLPKLALAASVTVPRVHLIASVYDEATSGNRRRLTQFAINPELREGIKTETLVTPGERMLLKPPGFAMAHILRKGHRLVLRVTTSDPDKVALFAFDPQVTIFSGKGQTALYVPVVDHPTLIKDRVSLKQP